MSSLEVKDTFCRIFDQNFNRPEASANKGKDALEAELLLRRVQQDGTWTYAPEASTFIKAMHTQHPEDAAFVKPEWSRGQVEFLTAVHSRDDELVQTLLQRVQRGQRVAAALGCELVAHEFIAPSEVSFDDGQGGLSFVSDYNPRCLEYAQAHPQKVVPMLRVLSLQPSFGMGELADMFACLNALMEHMSRLIRDPRWVHPGRLHAYEEYIFPKGWTTLVDEWTAVRDIHDLFELYARYGCAKNPKAFYGMVKPCTRYPRLEVRIPGTTTDPTKIKWYLTSLRNMMGLSEPEVWGPPALGTDASLLHKAAA